MFYRLRLMVFCIFVVCINAFAATDTEVRVMLKDMKADTLFKTILLEINSYHISKSQVDSQEVQDASLQEFANLVDKLLSWEAIEPLIVQTYSDTLSSSDVKILTTFFQSEASKPYLEGYLYASAPMAIALNEFVANIVNRLIDEPDLALDRIEKLNPQEETAVTLIQMHTSKKSKQEFAKNREVWLQYMDTLLKPTTEDKEELKHHTDRMHELGLVFSEEQVRWQMARVLSQQVPQSQIKQIIAELNDTQLLTALHNLNEAGEKAGELFNNQFLTNPEVQQWMSNTLSNYK